MIRGLIFDFDGTLFDSMIIWETAGEAYLRSVGKAPHEDLQMALKPMSLLQSAAYIKEQYAVALTVPQIMDGINRTVEDFYFHVVEPKPGVVEWLEELSAKGMKMCIATATDRYQVEAALQRCGMRSYFSGIFTCTQAGSGKDQPFVYRSALAHLGTDRSSTMVVEDAFHAIHTAKADEFMTAAVYNVHETRQEQLREMADVYLPDYHDMTAFWSFVSAEQSKRVRMGGE
ncbi:MAG: HAD family phosphatase [Clostridia bacterium]|nr:HAD family phosphatase [Clostridia bacterium]